MPKRFTASTTITDGTLRFYLYRSEDHSLIAQITDNGSIDVVLNDGESFFVTYQVVSLKEGSNYHVESRIDTTPLLKTTVTMHKGEIDYNTRPFRT